MKEGIKNICKKVYDGYQKLVAKERADAEYGGGFDKVDLMWGATGCVIGFVVCILLM